MWLKHLKSSVPAHPSHHKRRFLSGIMSTGASQPPPPPPPPTPPTPTPMMLSSDASGTLHSKRTHDQVSESKRAWVLGADELHLALFEGTTMNPRIILLKV